MSFEFYYNLFPNELEYNHFFFFISTIGKKLSSLIILATSISAKILNNILFRKMICLKMV